MSPDERIHRTRRLVPPRIRSGNQQHIQRLLPAVFRRRSADLIRDGGVNTQCGIRSAVLKRIGAALVDVDDLDRDGAGFERRGEEGDGGEEGVGDHAEDVNGGKVEQLDGVDEEDTDAGCGFRSHL